MLLAELSSVRESSYIYFSFISFIFLLIKVTSDFVPNIVVHTEDGSRIGCGIFKEDSTITMTASLTSLSNEAGETGEVMTIGLGETICFAGSASGLSFEAVCNPSETVNACGVHIQSGTACDNADTQGGHLYDMTEDHWKLVGYPTTDEYGEAVFGDCVHIGSLASTAQSKPFVVHKRDGSRVICGLLKSNPFIVQLDEKADKIEPKSWGFTFHRM